MELFTAARYADETQQIVAALVSLVLLASACWPERLWTERRWLRRSGLALLLAATLAAGWANYYQSRSHDWVHEWDVFHTAIGSKYFEELGYAHLYDCVYLFSAPGDRARSKTIDRIRDLRTLKMRKMKRFLRDSTCERRFSSDRRRELVADVRAFNDIGLKNRWRDLYRDKGYNGTPFYTFVARSVLTRISFTEPVLFGLACIDLVLLLVACIVVARTRGLVTALLVALLLSVCLPARYMHMGGSFLRFDYVALTLIALCALERGRAVVAGVLLAYATLVRAFPALYAGAVLLAFAMQAISARKLPREGVRFFAGFAGGLGALLALAALGGFGLEEWRAWAHEVSKHVEHSAGWRVGFKHVFMLDGSLTEREGFIGYREKTELFEPRRPYWLLACAALLLPLSLRTKRMSAATFASLFGTLAFFLFLIATRYYYAVLAVLLLASPGALGRRFSLVLAALLFAASAVGYSVVRAVPLDAFVYNTFLPFAFTVIALLLAVRCGDLSLRERRERHATR